MGGMSTKPTPYLLGETVLSPTDRAALMNGRTPRRGEHEDDDDLYSVRFVVTGQATGSRLPIVLCERQDGRDALGVPKWVPYDPPGRILAAALLRACNVE